MATEHEAPVDDETVIENETDDAAAIAVAREMFSALLDVADARVEANYTEASWTAFVAAHTAAEAIYEDAEATLEEISAEVVALTFALVSLQTREGIVNRVMLAIALASADLLEQADYTAETWTVFAAARTAAAAVYANAEATQAQVDAAEDVLIDAMADLIEDDTCCPPAPTVDRTLLALLLDLADALEEENFTAATWAAFEAALEAAEEVYADEDATQEEVDEAVEDLLDALEALEAVEGFVNRIALTLLFAAAELLEEEDFTAATWAVFEAALEAAEEVYADEDATQEEVNEAAEDLLEAMEALELRPEINRAVLAALLALAEALDEEDFTEETWEALEEALEAAAEVYADEDATQEEIDEAVEDLIEALEALETVEGVVNRIALAVVLVFANAREEENYTEETWEVFEAALEAAAEVYADEDATQEDIDEAVEDLIEAMEALVRIDAPAIKPQRHRAYMFGDQDGFRPEVSITRAEAAAVFVRTQVREFATITNFLPQEFALGGFDEFDDVNSGDWFYYYVAWAYAEGYVRGFDGKFRPNDPVTREELAAMLVRTGLVLLAEGTGEVGFPDFDNTSDWAKEYVTTVYELGLMVGDATTGMFRPQHPINRAETATAVNRLLGRIDSQEAWNAVEVENEDDIHTFDDVPESKWYFGAVVAATNNHDLTRDDDGAINWIEIIDLSANNGDDNGDDDAKKDEDDDDDEDEDEDNDSDDDDATEEDEDDTAAEDEDESEDN